MARRKCRRSRKLHLMNHFDGAILLNGAVTDCERGSIDISRRGKKLSKSARLSNKRPRPSAEHRNSQSKEENRTGSVTFRSTCPTANAHAHTSTPSFNFHQGAFIYPRPTGGGGSRNTANLLTNNIDFSDREGKG